LRAVWNVEATPSLSPAYTTWDLGAAYWAISRAFCWVGLPEPMPRNWRMPTSSARNARRGRGRFRSCGRRPACWVLWRSMRGRCPGRPGSCGQSYTRAMFALLVSVPGGAQPGSVDIVASRPPAWRTPQFIGTTTRSLSQATGASEPWQRQCRAATTDKGIRMAENLNRKATGSGVLMNGMI
jgi:hypothetical protein